MKKLFDIKTIKKVRIISILLLLSCLLMPVSAQAAKEKLPNCENISAGSAKCKCGYGLKKQTCEKGYYCDKMTTTNMDGVTTVYSCRPLKDAENYDGYYQDYTVIASDSASYSPTIKETACPREYKCLPGCKYNDVKECTLCPVFALVFNTVSKIGSLSAEKFSKSIITVVVIGFAIWLAMECLKFVASMKTKDLKDLVQAIITKGFIVMLVIGILRIGVGSFYDVFVEPVYNTAQNMAQMLFESGAENLTNEDDNVAKKDKSISAIDTKIKNGLPPSMGVSIIKTMTMMENRVRKLNAIGSGMMCSSFQDAWFIFPKIRYFIFGAAVWVLATSIIVIVPFIMIDSVFQLGVATALMPFAVGAYAFEYTKKMLCKKVWDTFLNSAFAFLFTSIVVLILLAALETSTQSTLGNIDGSGSMFAIDSSGDAAYAAFKETVSWGSGTFLNLFFIFLLAWSVMNMGTEFAKEFAGSLSSTTIGSDVGGKMGSFASSSASKIAAPAVNAAKKGAKSVARRTARGAKHLSGRISNNRAQRKFDRAVAAGSVSVVNGVQTFKDGNATISKDKNGNISRTSLKQKIKSDGTKVVTEHKEVRTQNAIVRIKTVTTLKKDDKGKWNVISSKSDEKMKITSEKADNLLQKDGKIDVAALQELLKGTDGETKKLLLSNVSRQINETRFSKVAFDPSGDKLAGPAETTIDSDGSIVTRYTKASGEVIISKTKFRNDGIAESTVSRIGKNGKVTTLQTDGIRNKMSVSRLEDGTDVSKLKSADDIMMNCKKDDKGRVIERVGYSYTEYYQGVEEDKIPDGMFFHKDKNGITRDEYGEVVRDAQGNIRGGAFERYMKNSQKSIFDSIDNDTGNQSKNRHYAETKSDMEFFFGSSKSRRVKNTIFGGYRGT